MCLKKKIRYDFVDQITTSCAEFIVSELCAKHECMSVKCLIICTYSSECVIFELYM